MRLLLLLFVCLSLLITPALADLNQDLNLFFSNYINPGKVDGVGLNIVAYKLIKLEPKLFNKIIKQYEKFDVSKLRTVDQKIAFWSNAYNFAAIKMIIDHHPVRSIRDIGNIFQSVWNKDIINIGGKKYTLGHIEHKILRKTGDPSIHLAISCASISCPNVRAGIYKTKILRRQLRHKLVAFLANPKKGAYLDEKNNILYLSSIFDWFKDDFKAYGGVLKYLKPYFPAKIKKHLKKNNPQIKYLEYNWQLNGF